jgi:SAM-dependent methyltransferase
MTYDESFYTDESRVALESAKVVLPILQPHLAFTTVIDIGCGTGAWAYVAQTHLACAVLGVDHGVPRHLLLIESYVDCDLENGYPCGGFDLAVCLEVAEHLPDTAARPLVTGLARARHILFSAATPGQPGVHHINCQPHTYWHALFAEHGFASHHLGPAFAGTPVADFYQRNMYLYTRSDDVLP